MALIVTCGDRRPHRGKAGCVVGTAVDYSHRVRPGTRYTSGRAEGGIAMPDAHFDEYHRYAALTARLQQFADRHPGLMWLASIGRSHERRDIWLATITSIAQADVHDKPHF